MSLLVAQLETEPMLGLLSSFQVGNGRQHHLPLAAEGLDAAQSTAESKPRSWGCLPEGPWRLPGCCAALLPLRRLPHGFVLLVSRPLGESWDLLFIVKDRKDLLTG